MHINIRPGREEDLEVVLTLIGELAAFERAANEVTINLQTLIQDGFGEDPAYGLVVGEWKGEVVGFALYYPRYSTWKGRCLYLEDLLVTARCRGKGIGTMLFAEVVKIAKRLKAQRLEWQVLNWNEEAISFYKKFDASMDGEWLNGRLVFEQLQK